MKPKIYISGPQYMLPDAEAYKNEQLALCEKYGFESLHPLNTDVDFSAEESKIVADLYQALEKMMKDCDIILADCNPLRGALMDDGAAYELGYCNALGKPSYGYVETLGSLSASIVKYFSLEKNEAGEYIDSHGYIVGDDFGTTINLMMQQGMTKSGGRLIAGNFEAGLQAIRTDIDSGILSA